MDPRAASDATGGDLQCSELMVLHNVGVQDAPPVIKETPVVKMRAFPKSYQPGQPLRGVCKCCTMPSSYDWLPAAAFPGRPGSTDPAPAANFGVASVIRRLVAAGPVGSSSDAVVAVDMVLETPRVPATAESRRRR